MKLDRLGLVVSEMYEEGHPATTGDSAAETSRWVLLKQYLDEGDFGDRQRLEYFFLGNKTIRHPETIWPDDATSDQCLPLYLACKLIRPDLAERLKMQIISNEWCTPNGDLVNPMFYAILNGSKWKLNGALLGQYLISLIPIRWSDSKKTLESSEGSTCDWLNWLHASQLASKWVRNLVTEKFLFEKISSYYSVEQNNSMVLDLYRKFLKQG